MLKPFLLLTAVVMFGLMSASAQAHPSKSVVHASEAKSQHGASAAQAAAADEQANAKALYQRDCALCHGASGDGKTEVAKSMDLTMSDWTDPKTLSGKSDKELFDAIRKGTDKMPPEDSARAKDSEVQGLITYIRSLAKKGTAGASTPAPASAPAPAPAAPASPNN